MSSAAAKIIRLATPADSAAILSIYAPFITNTVITFEYDVPSVMDFRQRISSILQKYPWLVCEIDGAIAGYAYASAFHQRAAYNWSVDLSIYIHPLYHGKKIAQALYSALLEMLRLQGYCNAYAGITLPNLKSERLHRSFGFTPVGVYRNVGYKMGQWHDVQWLELKIQDLSAGTWSNPASHGNLSSA